MKWRVDPAAAVSAVSESMKVVTVSRGPGRGANHRCNKVSRAAKSRHPCVTGGSGAAKSSGSTTVKYTTARSLRTPASQPAGPARAGWHSVSGHNSVSGSWTCRRYRPPSRVNRFAG